MTARPLLVRHDLQILSNPDGIEIVDAAGKAILSLREDVAERVRTLLRINRMTDRIRERLVAEHGMMEADRRLRANILPEFCRHADTRPPAPGGHTAEYQLRELLRCLPHEPTRFAEFIDPVGSGRSRFSRVGHLIGFMCQRRILGEPLNCGSLFFYLVSGEVFMLRIDRIGSYLVEILGMERSDAPPTRKGIAVGLRSCAHTGISEHAFVTIVGDPESVPVTMEIAGHSGEFRIRTGLPPPTRGTMTEYFSFPHQYEATRG